MTLAILDYGMGNLRSVQKAFEQVGAQARIITQPEQVDVADKLVLPGVGAFSDAMAALHGGQLDGAIRRHIQRGRPFLGICLGLQLLFQTSSEGGAHAGLGIIPGHCVRFDVDRTMGLKVPHMGWNTLNIKRQKGNPPLFEGLTPDSAVYFVHSYHVVPSDPSVISSTTDHGRPFVSSIWRDNLMATQFHPEKSQRVGLKVLANFLAS